MENSWIFLTHPTFICSTLFKASRRLWTQRGIFFGTPCTCRPSAWTWGRQSPLSLEIILLFLSLLSSLLAGVDVEALNHIEEVLHRYLEAVEASRSPLLNIGLYNDNVTMILWITPKFTFSCFSCLWIILRMESSPWNFIDRKVPRLWADDTWHRFSSWSKRHHINNLIIIFPDICRTVSKCKSKYGSLLLICWDDLADVTL